MIISKRLNVLAIYTFSKLTVVMSASIASKINVLCAKYTFQLWRRRHEREGNWCLAMSDGEFLPQSRQIQDAAVAIGKRLFTLKVLNSACIFDVLLLKLINIQSWSLKPKKKGSEL